ncbi:hypothetical protein L7F22_038239 [Adiantum nelumboides]|nr:hypothetical protein [Adiantum nelumboides]
MVTRAMPAKWANPLEACRPALGQYPPSFSKTFNVRRAHRGVLCRFNRLSWGSVSPSRPQGLLAAGLESGELNIWDAQKVLDGSPDSKVISNTLHTGPVRGLHFNPKQSNLLASGGVSGEVCIPSISVYWIVSVADDVFALQVFIWNMETPTKPYSPGAKSTKLDEITSLSWNNQVPHILATSSTSGYTVVWDLLNKREVTALAYGGGAGTAGGGLGSSMNGMALAAGGRRGMGAVCWHPDTPTRLVTASDDDASPIIMLWDLRNARAPEKILTGHDKGVLSLSWCKQDSDLLLSCGKDNRTICWNPQTSEIVGELPSSQNWSFDVQWCPKNPDLLATASFDGKIGVHSLQATNVPEATGEAPATQGAADGSDIFNLPAQTEAGSRGLSLKQPPKWLRKPISATFGFGGQLVSTVNLPGKNGQTQSSVVHIRDVVSEPGIAARAKKLQEALETQTLAEFCDERSKDPSTRSDDVANWKALQTLFRADSRDELVTLLGFSKEDVASKVASSISTFKKSEGAVAPGLSAPGTPSVKPVVESEVVAATTETSEVGAEGVATEAATSVINEASTKATTAEADGEPSLFGNSGDAQGGDADFFNSISAADGPVKSALPDRILSNGPFASSAAATAGSPGPSSVTSDSLKTNTFRIYPSDESDADKLITRALVLGDFESAVSLCVSADRFADALLLAVRGGQDLLARTQKAYFERRTTSLPYLRLFQSIVSDDLTDVVQNADLNEWQEIFVVLCTFAKAEEFASLAEQLGQRLEYQYERAKRTSSSSQAKQHRKDAVLCYLAAGKLEKVAGMWIDEMKEEELAIRTGQKQATDGQDGSLYTAHAEALQTFMEKITVFQSAVNYVDIDLAQPTQDAEAAATGARTYKLAALYDRIHEYVELLANQGLIVPALKYVQQTPSDYQAQTGENISDATTARERLVKADAARFGGKGAAAAAAQYQASTSAFASSNNAAASSSAYAPAPNAYDAYGAPAAAATSGINAYAQPQQQSQQQQPYGAANTAYDPYGTSAYGLQPQQQQQQAAPQPAVPSAYAPAQPMVPAPPPPIMAQAPAINPPAAPAPAPPAPPPKRDQGGWNDIPTGLATPRRTPSAMSNAKSAPITSPFPNAPAPQAPNMYGQGPPGAAVPPPPRYQVEAHSARPLELLAANTDGHRKCKQALLARQWDPQGEVARCDLTLHLSSSSSSSHLSSHLSSNNNSSHRHQDHMGRLLAR